MKKVIIISARYTAQWEQVIGSTIYVTDRWYFKKAKTGNGYVPCPEHATHFATKEEAVAAMKTAMDAYEDGVQDSMVHPAEAGGCFKIEEIYLPV